MREVVGMVTNTVCGERKQEVNELLFACDTTLVSVSMEKLQDLVTESGRACRQK